MRHQKNRHKIGRAKGHRTRTLQALSAALIQHKRIRTTEAKAKALRPFIEPLITRAKDDTQHNRRQVFRRLQNKWAVDVLFNDVAVEVGDRPGGYTRIVKLGQRPGDAAEMAMIELVDYNDVQPETGSGGRSRTRRGGGRGRRRRKSGGEEAAAAAAATEAEEVTQEDAEATADQEATDQGTESAAADEAVADEAAAGEEVDESTGEAAAEDDEQPTAEAAEDDTAEDDTADEEDEEKEA